MTLRLLALMACAVTACSKAVPSPQECRNHGVSVPDGDPVTGQILFEHYEPAGIVKAKCNGALNCFRAVGFENLVTITPKGEYEIWVSQPDTFTHERCHALYEETNHVLNH